tara:strand:+ start:943 stop:1380 length:438 start_codon:yes stop_codon:yes gene_type:complete
MKLSTKSRYAVQAMVDLAINSNNKPCNLLEISNRQNISLSYLEQIFNKLRKSNLVSSVKGPGGGYSLSKSPNKIRISEIVNGVEENIKVTGCGNHPSKFCTGKNEKCITHHFLEDLESLIENYLDSVALSDIALNKENSFLGLEQ